MGHVKFSGTVSGQVALGETVTVKVTLPDSTIESLTATTDTNGAFSVEEDYNAGVYSATFHIDQDANYTAADFGPVSFSVGLTTRTITANVVVS